MLPDRFRESRPVIRDLDHDRVVLQPGTYADGPRRRLIRVEGQVGKHAAKLVAVGVDGELLRHFADEARRVRPAFAQIDAHFLHQLPQLEARIGRRQFPVMREGQGLAAQLDRPVQRAEQGPARILRTPDPD